jgi:hypothetical protein
MDWSKVKQEGDCWVWTGYTNPEGYAGGDGRQHRRVYEQMVGDIPEGLTLDHLCRRPACLNPEHLDPVPIAINIQRGERATRKSCLNGHPFTPENTYLRPSGGKRQCRACNAAAARRLYARKAVA